MIVANDLATVLTFQQIMLTFLRDTNAGRSFANDGSSMTVTSARLPGLELRLEGIGLEDGGGGALAGQVTDFVLVQTATGASLDGLLPLVLLVTDMFSTARAGTGALTPQNFLLFYSLLMPGSLYQLLYTGSRFAEVAEGFDGNDEVDLLGGDDTFKLGNGTDDVDGGKGAHDKATGANLGNGIIANLGSGEITERNTANVTAVFGIEDVDGTASGDTLIGDNFNNRLNGKDGNDKLRGSGGDDVLNGGKGNDTLNGGDSNDSLIGGDNNDTLNGEAGDDSMSGGRGMDRFVFGPGGGEDRILDFEDGKDTLDLRGFGFESRAEMKALAANANGNVVLTAPNGNVLTVENMTKATLFDGDVLF